MPRSQFVNKSEQQNITNSTLAHICEKHENLFILFVLANCNFSGLKLHSFSENLAAASQKSEFSARKSKIYISFIFLRFSKKIYYIL